MQFILETEEEHIGMEKADKCGKMEQFIMDSGRITWQMGKGNSKISRIINLLENSLRIKLEGLEFITIRME